MARNFSSLFELCASFLTQSSNMITEWHLSSELFAACFLVDPVSNISAFSLIEVKSNLLD